MVMFDQVQQMQERIEALEEALTQIKQWCGAYPETVFRPLSDKQIEAAGVILKTVNIDIGALHAGWARHLLKGIGDIASAALERSPAGKGG